jgi:hypothetical protein
MEQVENLSKTYFYEQAIQNWITRNNYQVSEHITNVILSVLLTRDKLQIGGDFAKAICNNNLFETFRRADKEVWDNIRTIILAYHNISAYEYILFNHSSDIAAKFDDLPL